TSTRGGMLGALGGLAMGGLLGALLFGGAFEGINLFDVLVIGGLAAMLILLLRRHAATQPAYAGGPAPGNREMTSFGQGRALRPSIDEAHFLEAARNIYLRMQRDWDAGDLEDIRRFCTPDIAERIAAEMQQGHGHQTEVGMLEASIADAWIEQDAEWVSVHFRAMLREKTLDAQGHTTEDKTAEVNEIWHFRHEPGSDDPTWYLAGIQQVERPL
ncbi:MAG: Tim44 domain-containing protein, partial [Zetaproteobacteria bacterium]